MAEKLETMDPRIIYASLLAITILAIVMHLTSEKTYSLLTVLLIVVVALGNIGYIARKLKKPAA